MFVYDGFDFSDYLLVTDVGRPILPPRTIYDMKVFGKEGSHFFKKEDEPITIPVEIKIFEGHNMTFREMVRFLASKLDKEEPKPLIFNDEPHMFINGILEGESDLQSIVKAGEGVLNFFCPDPHFYAIDDEIFTFNSTGSFEVERKKGNTKSLPLIEIKGENPVLSSITVGINGINIKFTGMLQKEETLVLDSKLITSYIKKEDGTIESANDDIDKMTFPIMKQEKNTVFISKLGLANIESVTVHSRSRWK